MTTTVASRKESTALLSPQHHRQCCEQRGLNPDWIKASCKSLDIKQASDYLHYQAKSGGILIKGANGQYQLRPDQPWSHKKGQKAPKYRTAAGDEYDALLPIHPTDPTFWIDIPALKERCYKINGIPMIVLTEGDCLKTSLC